MKIEISEIAIKELAEIRAYIANDSEHYAGIFIEKVLDALKNLSKLPKSGRVVPETNRDDIRELIFKNYRIIYKIKGAKLIILTVLHGSRNLLDYSKENW